MAAAVGGGGGGLGCGRARHCAMTNPFDRFHDTTVPLWKPVIRRPPDPPVLPEEDHLASVATAAGESCAADVVATLSASQDKQTAVRRYSSSKFCRNVKMEKVMTHRRVATSQTTATSASTVTSCFVLALYRISVTGSELPRNVSAGGPRWELLGVVLTARASGARRGSRAADATEDGSPCEVESTAVCGTPASSAETTGPTTFDRDNPPWVGGWW